MIRSRMVICLSAAAIAGLAISAAAQQFIPIPPLPGHNQTFVRAVSGDGSVVVGTSGPFDSTSRAFYWTAATGVVELESNNTESTANAVSHDGSVIVGTVDGRGARWVNGKLDILSGTAQYPNMIPRDVSDDGTMIAGKALPAPPNPFGILALWTEDGITDLGTLGGGASIEQAYDISGDGSTITGIIGDEGFRWTASTGMQGLGFLPGTPEFQLSNAQAVSDDGSIIAGQADIGFDPGYVAAYWTTAAGWVQLPDTIPSVSVANNVNAMTSDGSVMVGIDTGHTPPARQLFIWDAVNGSRPLQDTLETEHGVDFGTWQLADLPSPHNNEGDVSDISGDGNVIVGVTLNPDTETRWGWFVQLETPNPADLTGDGVVNVFDLLDLLGSWGECADPNDCPADLTGDDTVNVFDLLDLLGAWG